MHVKSFSGRFNKEDFEHPKIPSFYFGCQCGFDFTGWRMIKVKITIEAEPTKTQSVIEINEERKDRKKGIISFRSHP